MWSIVGASLCRARAQVVDCQAVGRLCLYSEGTHLSDVGGPLLALLQGPHGHVFRLNVQARVVPVLAETTPVDEGMYDHVVDDVSRIQAKG